MRQIGREVGYKGLQDDAIIPLLHQLPRPTFFTRDDGFYRRTLCRPAYCLVYLAVGQYEADSFVRRFLQHPSFATYARRRGTGARVGHTAVRLWRLHQMTEEVVRWRE